MYIYRLLKPFLLVHVSVVCYVCRLFLRSAFATTHNGCHAQSGESTIALCAVENVSLHG